MTLPRPTRTASTATVPLCTLQHEGVRPSAEPADLVGYPRSWLGGVGRHVCPQPAIDQDVDDAELGPRRARTR